MPALDLNKCSVTLSAKKHYDFPDIVCNVSVKVKYPGHEDSIAYLMAILINRDKCPLNEFHLVMDDISDELKTFATSVFDIEGKLRDKFIDHEHHRGTGCWGREIDEGMLVYIDAVRVEKQFRHMGVASLALQALLTSKYVRTADTVVTWPCYLCHDVDTREERAKQLEISLAFFQKHGFRRIGRTQFTAFSSVSTHPSRLVAILDDVQSDNQIHGSQNPEDWGVKETICSISADGRPIRKTVDKTYAQRYPLHHIIAESAGLRTNMPEMKDLILRQYPSQSGSLRVPDREGYTPLHIAAKTLNLPAVEALLSLKPPSPSEGALSAILVLDDLKGRDNVLGSTPLELCEEKLLQDRECFESISQESQAGRWPGYDERGLKIAYALRCAAGEDVGGAQSEDEYVKFKRWGCTCGLCAGGWLSERMRFRLRMSARETYDTLNMDWVRPNFDEFNTTQYNPQGLSHLPLDIRPRINAAFYDGYAASFKFLDVILAKMNIPVVQNVSQSVIDMSKMPEVSPIFTGYIAAGGKVEWALDAIMFWAHLACEYDPLLPFDEIMEDIEEWRSLPRCKNDKAFSMVRTRMGLDPCRVWGPYEDPEAELEELRRLRAVMTEQERKEWDEQMEEVKRRAEEYKDIFGEEIGWESEENSDDDDENSQDDDEGLW